MTQLDGNRQGIAANGDHVGGKNGNGAGRAERVPDRLETSDYRFPVQGS